MRKAQDIVVPRSHPSMLVSDSQIRRGAGRRKKESTLKKNKAMNFHRVMLVEFHPNK
jgi:hypothetical protein